jgi:hemerythrin-like metal-binding protein
MPTPILGVPLMDRDHEKLGQLFAQASKTEDAGLPAALEAIATELGAHFAREEALMTEARVPILLCHLELHAQLLREVEKMRETIGSLDADTARQIVCVILPGVVANHVATADTASASFLR